MTLTTQTRIWVLAALVMFCSLLFMGAKAWEEAEALNLRNATDSLMPLVELATESGPNCIAAKAVHTKLINDYVGHMESRHIPFLLQLPPFSKNNIVKRLKRVVRHLEDANDQNACKAIDDAGKSFAEFLSESKPFTSGPITAFKPEVMSKEIRDKVKKSLEDAHGESERYAGNESRTIDDAETACMANRRAIVYLYLARFGYQEIVSQKTLEKFRTAMNRTVSYNRFLQQTPAVQSGKGVKDSPYELLERYSDSEIRRLRLLHAIIDNDIQKARDILKTAIEEAIPNIQFLSETR